MFSVHVWGRGSNEDVINIDFDEFQALRHVVHKSLKRFGSVSEAKIHFGEFKQPEWCRNGCYQDFLGSYKDLVERPYEVSLGVDSGTKQMAMEIHNVGYEVPIRLRHSVEGSVVFTGSPSLISLRDHVQG